MIAERIQQQQPAPPPQAQSNGFSATAKYYQFSTILEHVIDCFHTIVSDETNPYHPPLAWLTRKQPKPPNDELFMDLHDECSKISQIPTSSSGESIQLSASVRSRLEKSPQQLRQEIVSRTRDECSPLFIACKNGLTRVVKYLLDVCGADIEQRGRFEALESHHVHSVTPLWVAAVSGHLETVKLLIDRGANINSISDTGSTPIRSVCFLCRDDDGLLATSDTEVEYDNFRADDYSFGGDTDDRVDSGTTREDTYMKIVFLLAEHGADMSLANYNGGTCLINSLHNYHLTEYVLNHEVNINASDNQLKTALHYAIQTDRVQVVKLLLARGADPFLKTNNCDDALQLCCLGGHEKIFEHLVENYQYSLERLADAYKLLGSSILETHYDLTKVRHYWTRSLDLIQSINSRIQQTATTQRLYLNNTTTTNNNRENYCDTRRVKAFGDMAEFTSAYELRSLTVDDFRIQSLLISERILGSWHRETIQRLLYRGTFYINSLRPKRCLDMWIYALKLRLEHESIFHIESIWSAQAIIKLFLDLFGQHQHQQVEFNDVHDVLSLLVDRLEACQHHMSLRPRSRSHEDIYELLLSMIVNLMLILHCVQRNIQERQRVKQMVEQLVRLNPRTSNGSTLLHISIRPNMFEGDSHRALLIASEALRVAEDQPTDGQHFRVINNIRGVNKLTANERHLSLSPVAQLIANLIDAGFEVDQTNGENLSVFQSLCLSSGIRTADKSQIIGLLLKRGAHIDRRALTPEQDEQIRQTMRECNIKPLVHTTLKCLAARSLAESRIKFDKTILASDLEAAIAIH